VWVLWGVCACGWCCGAIEGAGRAEESAGGGGGGGGYRCGVGPGGPKGGGGCWEGR